MEQKKWAIVGAVVLFLVLPVVVYFTVPAVEAFVNIRVFDTPNDTEVQERLVEKDPGEEAEQFYNIYGSHRYVLKVNGEVKYEDLYNSSDGRFLVTNTDSDYGFEKYTGYSPSVSSGSPYVLFARSRYNDSSSAEKVYNRNLRVSETKDGAVLYSSDGKDDLALSFYSGRFAVNRFVGAYYNWDSSFRPVGETKYKGRDVFVLKKAWTEETRNNGLPTVDIPFVSDPTVLYVERETDTIVYADGKTSEGNRFSVRLEPDVSPSIEEPSWTDEAPTYDFQDIQSMSAKIERTNDGTLEVRVHPISWEYISNKSRRIPFEVYKNGTQVASSNFPVRDLDNGAKLLSDDTVRVAKDDEIQVVIGRNKEFVFNETGNHVGVKSEWRVRNRVEASDNNVTVRLKHPTFVFEQYRLYYNGNWKTLAKDTPEYANPLAVPPEKASVSFERSSSTHLAGHARQLGYGPPENLILIPVEQRAVRSSGTLTLNYEDFKENKITISLYNKTSIKATGNYADSRIAEAQFETDTPGTDIPGSVGNVPTGNILVQVRRAENGTLLRSDSVTVRENTTTNVVKTESYPPR